MPDQEAVDEIRSEARAEALWAISDLERLVRGDEGMGGIDAIRISTLVKQLTDRVHVYRMTVNVGDEPALRTLLADAEQDRRRGIGRRRRRF